MMWKFKTFGDYVDKISKWHKYFTWFPVNVGYGKMCWLETVERRGDWVHNYCDDYIKWTYRRTKEIKNETH